MNVLASIVLVTLAATSPAPVAPASATPAASPAAGAPAVPAEDPAVTARAKEWLHRLQTGNIDRLQLTDLVNSGLTPTTIKQLADKFGPLGDPVRFVYEGTQVVAGDNVAYIYGVTFKTGAITYIFVLDKNGKISGLQVPPT